MATHDYIISNASGAAVRADLNNALAAIATNNSSATEPTTTYAYQWWADTGSSPTVMKLRNAANSGWVTLFQLDGEWSLIPFENGTAAAPSIYFKDSGTDTGFYSPGVDQVGITTGGVARLTTSTTAVTSTLPVVYPLGAVGTPSVTFTGDLNTGIWSPAADTIAFSEGGAEAMRIDSSGRLGIGTASPASLLDVNGFGRFLGTATITYPASGEGVELYFDGPNDIGYVQAYDRTAAAWRAIRVQGDQVQFGTGGNERCRIDSSGRLLVGTTTARGTLFTSGVTPTLQIEGTSPNTAALSIVNSAASVNGATLTLAKQRSGSVGGNTLVNSGDELGQIAFQGGDGTDCEIAASIQAFVDGTPGANDMPGRLVFNTTADGASTPTERMRITSAGELLVAGTNDNGAYNIQCNGTGVWGFGAYVNGSDERLKDNITPMPASLDVVKALNPVTFQYKSEFTADTSVQPGFIAQELQTALADQDYMDGVVQAGGQYLNVAYQALIPVLTKALQEAIAKIEALEAKVAALEAN